MPGPRPDRWLTGAELAGPELVAGGVVLAHERVTGHRPVWPGSELPCGVPGHVDARGVHGDAGPIVSRECAELAGPELVAGGVVLAHEHMASPRAGLAGQQAASPAT